MARIKSALELAMERTENVKGDSRKLTEHERKQDGKRLLARFYQVLHEGGIPGTEKDPVAAAREQLAGQLNDFPSEEQAWVRSGVTEVLLAGINLPEDQEALDNLERMHQASLAISSDTSAVETLFQQAQQVFSQYLEEKQQLTERLQQQFAPRLRQKEEAYAKQTGQRVSIAPEQDPEFQQYLQQGMDQLKEYYAQAADQIREQLRARF